jgi:hypothetical protein
MNFLVKFANRGGMAPASPLATPLLPYVPLKF